MLDAKNSGKIPFKPKKVVVDGDTRYLKYFDVLSAAVHEWGHMSGWSGHWDDDGADTDDRPDYKAFCRMSDSQTSPLPAEQKASHPYKDATSVDDIFAYQPTMCSIQANGTTHRRSLRTPEKDAFRNWAIDRTQP